MKSWNELTEDEQDTAMNRMYLLVLQDLMIGAKAPLNDDLALVVTMKRRTHWHNTVQLQKSLLENPKVEEWLANVAGQLAAEAYYIPDDGRQVVRI